MFREKNILIHNIFRKNLMTVFWQELMFALGTLIDGVIISRFLGSMAMAALGVNFPFASILAIFSGMIGIGCQTGCSKKIGEGKTQEAKIVYSTMLALSVVVSVVLVFVFFFFSKPIIISWGAKKSSSVDNDILCMASDYLKASSFGIPGMVIYYVLSPALFLEGKRKYIKISTLILMGANIAGDLLNIFLFHGGMAGMGASTSVSYLISLAIMIYGMLRGKGMFSFRFADIHITRIPGLLYYGLSKAVRRACNALRPIFLNHVIAFLCGGSGLAALSVQGNLRAFIGGISAAIAGTMLYMAGVFYHEKDKKSIEQTFREAIRGDLFIAVPLAVLFFLCAKVFVSIYIKDSPEVAELAVLAVRCYAAALPFVVFNEIYINYFQSVGNVPMASLISALSRVGMIAPCGIFALVRKSVTAAFFSLFLSEFLLSLAIILGLLFFGKGNSLIQRLSVLTKDLSKDIKWETTVPEMKVKEALTEFPVKVCNICENQGLDRKTANKLRLLCEEFLLFLNESEKNQKRNVSVRIIENTDESVVLFIRNDCELKNVESELDSHLQDKSYMENALSERILMFMSDSYNYKNTFGLNHAVFTVSPDLKNR